MERLRRAERSAKPPDPATSCTVGRVARPVDGDAGACAGPRGGGWRAGAGWAREDAVGLDNAAADEDLPAHRRPTIRQLGRSSEPADHPFKAMPPDTAAPGRIALPNTPLATLRSEGRRVGKGCVCTCRSRGSL